MKCGRRGSFPCSARSFSLASDSWLVDRTARSVFQREGGGIYNPPRSASILSPTNPLTHASSHQSTTHYPLPTTANMKFTMGSLVTAALATVASSAVVARRATALPASFGLEFVSSDAAINGVRVKYSEGVSSPPPVYIPITRSDTNRSQGVLNSGWASTQSVSSPPPPFTS